MTAQRPALNNINVVSHGSEGLVSLKNYGFESVPTKEIVTEATCKKKINRPSNDSNYDMFEIEDEDSDVVKTFKKTAKLIFQPASVMLGVRTNFNWKPRNEIMFIVALFVIFYGWTCVFYTHYLHVINGETIRNLEVFTVYGIGLSGTLKLVNYTTNFKKLLPLLHFMLKICRRRNPLGRQAKILKEELQKCGRNLKIFTISIFSNVAVLFLSVPVITYFVRKELIPLTPLECPFLDLSSLSGYLIIVSKEYLHEVSGHEQVCDFVHIELDPPRFRFIFSYIAVVKSIFDVTMFAFFSAAHVSQIICLFEIAKSCQNASELEIGPLASMNLPTGVEIMKSIYSYYTILTELL
ncbi:hypothetical protein Bhyg_00704 [Pseudolycoriella hygida]|uniref:Odorant receptor n=1 Tax=Pseudolycoriella hygida TaxID=35572 RepID=A0A9Q0N814_9DIPT|nr:hypothetical protein Bhyg_00704 [Pseudolycoriella hygida]